MRYAFIFILAVCLTGCADQNDDKVHVENTEPATPNDTLYITYDNNCGDKSELESTFEFTSPPRRLSKIETYEARPRHNLSQADLQNIADGNPCLLLISSPAPLAIEDPIPAKEDFDFAFDANAKPSFFNDPKLKKQKFFETIHAADAYKILLSSPDTTSPSVLVGVLDGGFVNPDHPDLKGQLHAASDISRNKRDIGHGQQVLGVIAARANNNEGIAGVAGLGARFLYKSILSNTVNSVEANLAEAANTIRAMGEMGVDVVNVSVAAVRTCPNSRKKCTYPLSSNPTIALAMREVAKTYGTLFVVSGGNDGASLPAYNHPRDGILVVGAVNSSGRLANYSNYGVGIDIFVPDTGIHVLTFNGYSSSEQGTSFVAPVVAGVAALIKGYLKQNEITLSAAEMTDLILGSSLRNSRVESYGGTGLQLDFGRAALKAQQLAHARR